MEVAHNSPEWVLGLIPSQSLAGNLFRGLGVCTSMILNNNSVYHTSISVAALFADGYIEPPGPYISTSPS